MKYSIMPATGLALLACTACTFSYAEADTQLETTLVTGTRSEQPAINLPASIQTVTADQIRLSGATNLAQVLNTQAGIQIKDTIGNQGRGTSVSMRGFGENSANNVLILVDGRKLNNPSLAGPDLASIALKDVERVDIIQGSAGTLYGDQATGGVINIITKKANKLSGFVEAGGGTDGYENYQGAVSQALDNGFNYRVSAEKRLADNYRDNNQADYNNLFANIGYESDRVSAFIEGQHVNDNLRLPGSLTSADIRVNRRQTLNPTDFSNRDTDNYRLGGDIKLNNQWKLLAEYGNRDADSKGSLYSTPFTDSTTVQTFTPRLSGNINTANGPLLVTAGIDWEDSDYKSNNAYTATSVNQTIEDVYTQLIVPTTQNLDITLGARHSDFELKDRVGNNKHDASLTVYQAGLNYDIDADSRVFLRRDGAFRWANADENGFISPGIEFLKPQKSSSWEMGYEATVQSLFVSVLAYHMTVDNEIIYDPSADGPYGPGTGANTNLDQSKRNGAVLRGTWQAADDLSIEANYSYTRAEFSSGTFDGNTIPFVAKSTANLIVTYSINQWWSLYADAQYTGPRYASGDDANIGGELGGYTLYNANIRMDLDGFYAQLRLNNITGKEYNGYSGGVAPYDYNYPAPESNYQLSVGYRF